MHISPNCTWLVPSRLDTTRRFRCVEPVHFGCVELVKQHGSTRSSRHAQHVERVVSCRDVKSLVEFGQYPTMWILLRQQYLCWTKA